MFEVRREGTRDRVQRAIGLAAAGEKYMYDAVGVFDLTIAGEAVEHEGKTLVALHVAWTFEEFIEHRADQILRR